MPTKKGRSAAALVVELPGIEPATEMALTSGDTGFDDPKQRESTRNDLRIRDRC
jgi:hypothetical protein